MIMSVQENHFRPFNTARVPKKEISDKIGFEINNHPENFRHVLEVNQMAMQLIEAYKSVLTGQQLVEAKKAIWGSQSVEDYLRRFQVVLRDYRFWEMTPERYGAICGAISENNRSWLQSFNQDYQHKAKLCKRFA